jgi:hypothetical protein
MKVYMTHPAFTRLLVIDCREYGGVLEPTHSQHWNLCAVLLVGTTLLVTASFSLLVRYIFLYFLTM